jgi:hypothetical protein
MLSTFSPSLIAVVGDVDSEAVFNHRYESSFDMGLGYWDGSNCGSISPRVTISQRSFQAATSQKQRRRSGMLEGQYFPMK